MNRERWEQLQELFHQAVQLDSGERRAFLDQHCSSDLELRRELEEMLAAERELSPSFLEGPALQRVARDLSTPSIPSILPSGTRLGSYEIVALIGAGGMGEVYRARDSASGVKSPSRSCRLLSPQIPTGCGVLSRRRGGSGTEPSQHSCRAPDGHV